MATCLPNNNDSAKDPTLEPEPESPLLNMHNVECAHDTTLQENSCTSGSRAILVAVSLFSIYKDGGILFLHRGVEDGASFNLRAAASYMALLFSVSATISSLLYRRASGRENGFKSFHRHSSSVVAILLLTGLLFYHSG